MTVKVRAYRGGGWEYDLRFSLPDGREVRERRKSDLSGKLSTIRFAEARERELYNSALVTPAALPEPPKQPEKAIAPSVREFSKRFLAFAEAEGHSIRELEAKRSILRLHLLPHLEGKTVGDVGPAEISALKTLYRAGYEIAGEKIAPTNSTKSVANRLAVLSKLLRVAHEWGERANPPPKLGVKVRGGARPEIFEPQELDRLLASAKELSPNGAYPALLLGSHAGLRSGELSGLEWSDVDLRAGRLTVKRQVQRGRVVLPKGGKTREVPLSARLSAALKGLGRASGRVLRVGEGAKTGVVSHEVLRVWLRTAEGQAGLPKRGCLHRLRHTFCSSLAAKGVPPTTIQALAGHADLRTTLRYIHLHQGAKEAAIALLDRLGWVTFEPPDWVGSGDLDRLEPGSAFAREQGP